MGVEDQRLQAAGVGVVEGRGRGRDLLPHVALHKAEELRGEVVEVGNNGVHRDEVEGQLRVGVRIVVGLHALSEGGRERGEEENNGRVKKISEA